MKKVIRIQGSDDKKNIPLIKFCEGSRYTFWRMLSIVLTLSACLLIEFSSGIKTCPQTIINGKGISAINDLLSDIALDFGYNRSIASRNSKLLYDDDSLVNSKLALSVNQTNPVSFASLLVPMSPEDYKDNDYPPVQSFPVMATWVTSNEFNLYIISVHARANKYVYLILVCWIEEKVNVLVVIMIAYYLLR